MNAWLETDEYEEVTATLRAARKFVDLASGDVTYWKWIFIALHNAVQGCMVIALTGSDSLGAIDPKQERAWREAHALREEPPRVKEKLLSFLKLYAKIRRKGTLQYSSAERFVPSGKQGYSMKKLSQVRDEFIHFTPKGWCLNLSGAPQLAIDCLDVAHFLAANCGRFCLYTSFREGELVGLINDLKAALIALK